MTSLEITTSINSDSSATANFQPAALTSGPTEYRGEVNVGEPGRLLFLGWVVRAKVTNRGVGIEARNGMQLNEKRIAGLAHAGMTDTELVWSIGRLAGFGDEHLIIGGLRRIADRFEVVMPVRGLALGSEFTIGAVVVSNDAGGSKKYCASSKAMT